MRATTQPIRFASLLALACLAGVPTTVPAQEPDPVADAYEDGNFGRVRYQENDVVIERAEADASGGLPELADLNAPIFPGDSIRTGVDQRIEVQLALGSLVRVDRDSEVTFLALPDPYRDLADNTVLQLGRGTLRITTPVDERGGEEFRVDTPAASIYLLSDASVRIEVTERGQTRVHSRRGVIEVAAGGGSVILRGGTGTEVDPGGVPHDPTSFNTFASDGFDRWVEEREASYRTRDRYDARYDEVTETLPAEVRPYRVELAIHGDWVRERDYGYVWYPAGVDEGWRPYQDGYWGYGPHGYFWISNEPWGWAPYHYGRWAWTSGRGWCWIPGRTFGGAWVAWSWGSAYVGWAPLDYWNRPAYRSVVHYGYYDPYCWTFVGHGHLSHRDRARYGVTWDRVQDTLPRAAVVTSAPRVPPRRIAESTEAREAVVRQLKDRGQRVAPTASGTQRDPSFADTEKSVSRRVPRATRGSLPPAVARERRSAGSPAVTPPRTIESGGTRRAAPDRRTMTPIPRRESATPRDAAAAGGRRATAAEPQPAPVRRMERDSRSATERMRDLYRGITSPRADGGEAVESATPRGPAGESKERPKARPEARSAPPSRRVTPPESSSSPRGEAPRRANDDDDDKKKADDPGPRSAAPARSGPGSTASRNSGSGAARARPAPTRNGNAQNARPAAEGDHGAGERKKSRR